MAKRTWFQISCLEAGGGLGGRSPPSTASGWLRDYGSNIHEFWSLNSVQNPGQIVAKMVQNRGLEGVKMLQNRGLEGVWGAFGRLWGRSWVSSGSEPPVSRFLSASWAALGRFVRRLGRLLGGSWAVLGTKLGRPGFLEAFWRPLARFFTLRVLLYLRLSILVDFGIQHT